MKKVIIIAALIALCLSCFGCGGGAGSAQAPSPGVNPGFASIVQLLPVRSVAQTNSFLSLKVKVLDGNGMPVAKIPVIFTNFSLLGVLSSTGATTDVDGLASVTLFSSTSGFATVQAEVNTGAGVVRDQKTVFFDSRTTEQISPSTTTAPAAVLTLDVDDGDGVFNEPDDFTLFKTLNDNTRTVRATLTQASAPVTGTTVTYGADRPFKTSPGAASCSDGSKICDVVFLDGNVKTTNNSGQATATVQVVPSTLSPIQTVLNITASTTSPVSFNVVSLFLKPVTISSVSISANPQSVDSGGTSTISAGVTTSAGTPSPDGTTVNFTTLTGGIDPFSQTTNGIATAKFTAPTVTVDTGNVVTASVGGKSASVNMSIIAPPVTPPPVAALAITPTTFNITTTGASGSVVVEYVVTGGVPGYTVHFTIPTQFNVNGCPPPTGQPVGYIDYTSGVPGSVTQDGQTVASAFKVTYAWCSGNAAKFQVVVSDSSGKNVTSDVTLAP